MTTSAISPGAPTIRAVSRVVTALRALSRQPSRQNTVEIHRGDG